VAPPWTAAGRLLLALVSYARIAWWGSVGSRLESDRERTVFQGVVRSPEGVLLAMRSDLWGWELPGGGPEPGEGPHEALRRELREETGLEVEVLRHVGDYVRTGFRPHTARVYECRPLSGTLRTSPETRALRWVDPSRPPETLLPWYRAPLADALAEAAPVRRSERQGLGAIWAGLRIDLRLRLREP
jgi:8-oxo-dGTP diphosphatase